jgi:hypothetical protein
MTAPSYPARMLLGVLAYAGLPVVSANLVWFLRRRVPQSMLVFVQAAERMGQGLWLGDLLRIAYHLGAPYSLLHFGWASPLELGLVDLDWIASTGRTLALGAGALAILIPLWWQYLRLVDQRSSRAPAGACTPSFGWAYVLREAILTESWLGFCRAPFLLLAGRYYGAYLGLGLATAAAVLNPWKRRACAVRHMREDMVLAGTVTLLSTTLYVFTRNLWGCMVLHYGIRQAMLWTLGVGPSTKVASSS